MARFSGQNDLKSFEENEPEVVGEIVKSLIDLADMGKPRTDDEVQQRIDYYFRLCAEREFRPGIESMSAALGISRKTLYAWRKGKGCSEYRTEIVNRAVSLCHGFLEQAILRGKINPASGIFFLKNWAGYKDTVSFEEVTQPDEVSTYDKNKMIESLGIRDDLAQLEDAEFLDIDVTEE